MAIIDWFVNLPPASVQDTGFKILIYLSGFYILLIALIVFFITKNTEIEKKGSRLSLDITDDKPIPSNIPAKERVAILDIEKSKFIAAKKALAEKKKKEEISDAIFQKLAVRYEKDIQKIENEIERTAREEEVSKLEEELKQMRGAYISKIKGKPKKEQKTTASTAPPTTKPPTAPPTAPPTTKPPTAPPTAPPTTKPPTAPPTAPPTTKPPTAPPTAPPTTKPPTAPPTAPPTTKPPTAPPTAPPTTKPPTAPPTAASETEEGDLFAKSTSIAALRKEMLKELDRLKKFMSEQQ